MRWRRHHIDRSRRRNSRGNRWPQRPAHARTERSRPCAREQRISRKIPCRKTLLGVRTGDSSRGIKRILVCSARFRLPHTGTRDLRRTRRRTGLRRMRGDRWLGSIFSLGANRRRGFGFGRRALRAEISCGSGLMPLILQEPRHNQHRETGGNHSPAQGGNEQPAFAHGQGHSGGLRFYGGGQRQRKNVAAITTAGQVLHHSAPLRIRQTALGKRRKHVGIGMRRKLRRILQPLAHDVGKFRHVGF